MTDSPPGTPRTTPPRAPARPPGERTGRRADTTHPPDPAPTRRSKPRRRDRIRPPGPRQDRTGDPVRDPAEDVSREHRDPRDGRSRETTPETRGGLTARDLTRPRALRTPRHPGRPVSGQWFIDQIETAPMTPEQHRTAVRALAALIAEWQEKNNPPENAK